MTAKFRASKRLRFEDAKRIMSPKICPKSFGTFEKQAPGHNSGNSVPYSFRTVRGFFYVPQDYEELRDGAHGFIVLVRED